MTVTWPAPAPAGPVTAGQALRRQTRAHRLQTSGWSPLLWTSWARVGLPPVVIMGMRSSGIFDEHDDDDDGDHYGKEVVEGEAEQGVHEARQAVNKEERLLEGMMRLVLQVQASVLSLCLGWTHTAASTAELCAPDRLAWRRAHLPGFSFPLVNALQSRPEHELAGALDVLAQACHHQP